MRNVITLVEDNPGLHLVPQMDVVKELARSLKRVSR